MKDQLRSMSLKQILGGRNLYLIGMMGSGKTLTGPCLAQNIDYGFVDSDEVIEKVAHQSIDEIFKEDGETIFRDLETKVLKELQVEEMTKEKQILQQVMLLIEEF